MSTKKQFELNREALVVSILNDSIIFDRLTMGINIMNKAWFGQEVEGHEPENKVTGYFKAFALFGLDTKAGQDDEIIEKLGQIYWKALGKDIVEIDDISVEAIEVAQNIYIEWLGFLIENSDIPYEQNVSVVN